MAAIQNRAPAWDLSNAYVSVEDAEYRKARNRLDAYIHILDGLMPNARDAVSINMAFDNYAKAAKLLRTLIGFCRCESALSPKHQKAAKESFDLWETFYRLQLMLDELFHFLDELPESDRLWKDLDFNDWKECFAFRRNLWLFRLPFEVRQSINAFRSSNFVPCYDLYSSHSAQLVASVKTMDGLRKSQSLSQCATVLKVSEDPVLRESTFKALNEMCSQNAHLYASLLNMIGGFRLKSFALAGCDFLTPSYCQNHVSSAAVDSLIGTIQENLKVLRTSVTLRAQARGQTRLAVCDLNAPFAKNGKSAVIPFDEALERISCAGNRLDPHIPDLFEDFVRQGWIETRKLPAKHFGAFFQDLPDLAQYRIFLTYSESFASMSQLSLMLGHAWHARLLQGQPFPRQTPSRVMMEMAAHFFTLCLFEEIEENGTADEREEALWQEMVFISNYILNMGVRFDFERQFLQERSKGSVSIGKINEILQSVWTAWYGESTQTIDPYLWIGKGQFYKIDDYFYNYPYIFGFTAAYGLLELKKGMPETFPTLFREFLSESGALSADDLFANYFTANLHKRDFWQLCMKGICRKLKQFEADFLPKKPNK